MLFQNGETIVFTGDSVTDANRPHPHVDGNVGGKLGNGYVRTIDTILNAVCPDLYLHICNTGTSGNTSRDLLARFDNEVLALQPDYVVCMIGVNDVWRQFDEPTIPKRQVEPAEYNRNIAEIIDRTEAAGKKIIMMTPFFIESNRADLMRNRVDEYATILKRVCEVKGVMCVDIQSVIDDYLKHRYSAYLSWDRVHPSEVACMLIAKAFLNAVGFEKSLF